jgi:hypothetical protein
MPKKSSTARGAAQRNKPRVQKSFELVRESAAQVADEAGQEFDVVDLDDESEEVAVSVPTMAAPEAKKTTRAATQAALTTATQHNSTDVAEREELPETPALAASAAPKGSAAAKLAARRHAAQKAQQRASASLITAEHYTYVRKDLIFIAILALIMFAIIVTLHFVPGIGY